MGKQRTKAASKREDDDAEEAGAAFAWEFTNDELSGHAPSGLLRNTSPKGFTGTKSQRWNKTPSSGSDTRADQAKPGAVRAQLSRHMAPSQINFIREQLDRALDRWWAAGELPPLALLRDGLLLLESGGTLAESQRTLLLRTALAHQRGLQTALRHQDDPERVALILAEALIEWERPIEPARVYALLRHDERIRPLLIAELERLRVLLAGAERQRAQQALAESGRNRAVMQEAMLPHVRAVPASYMPRTRRRLRQFILVLLLLALLGFALWQLRGRTPPEMVAMPGAAYALLRSEEVGGADGVQLAPFLIDRDEVSNQGYRRCVEAGACPFPVETNSATRPDYFMNPAFDEYPVVNVTQAMASAYCNWLGKRLPSEAEWQAAASVSPMTGQAFRYPWGEVFEAQRANGGSSANEDTLATGSFRPAGNSPAGLTDMAGNVAEWTSTLVPESSGQAFAVVKGGSYASDRNLLLVGERMMMAPEQASVEVGFRCARAHLRGAS